jgi:hypothetical protein
MVPYRMEIRTTLPAPEEMKCRGCSADSKCSCIYEIKECCENRKIDNCGYCNEYPCSKINKTLSRTEEYRKTVKKITTKEEFELFKKAFYCKKENLNKAKESL